MSEAEPQIERESRYAPAGRKGMVSEGREGGLQVLYRGRKGKWREIPAPVPRIGPPLIAQGHARALRKKLHRPASDHPWKKWRPKPWQPSQATAAAASGAVLLTSQKGHF